MRLRNYVNQVLSLQTGQPVEKARPPFPLLQVSGFGGTNGLRIYVKAAPLTADWAAVGSGARHAPVSVMHLKDACCCSMYHAAIHMCSKDVVLPCRYNNNPSVCCIKRAECVTVCV